MTLMHTKVIVATLLGLSSVGLTPAANASADATEAAALPPPSSVCNAPDEKPVFKLITMLKRRSGMSMAEFVTAYETEHAVIGAKVLKDGTLRYFRRYLFPTDGASDNSVDPPYDVVMEQWFDDFAAYEKKYNYLREPETQAEIRKYGGNMFEPGTTRTFFVQECESRLN